MTISLDDFKKIDLRIGTVTHVADHPDADRLYILTVTLENEERTLVAGLKKYYSLEELQGRQIVVIANLEPAKVRGITSQGMLLAAQSGETVCILSPDKPSADGAWIF
jgi:methionyl-tRNA synthetase